MNLLRHAVVHRDDAVLHARPEVADELVLAVFVRVIRLEVVEPAEVVVHRTVVVVLDFREILVVRREEIHRDLRVHRRGVRHVGDDGGYVVWFDDGDFAVVFISAACDMFDVGDDFGAAQVDGAVLHGAVPVDQRRARHAVEVVRLHDAHDVAVADEPPAMVVVVTRRKQYLLAPVSAEGIDLVLSERALCVVPHARTRHGRGSAGIVAHLQIDGGSAPADHAGIDVERAFRLRPFDEIVGNVLRVAGRLRNREGRLAGRDRFVAGERQRGADLRRAAEYRAGRHLARPVVHGRTRRVARERPFHGLSLDRRSVVEFDGGGELRLLARNNLCRAGHGNRLHRAARGLVKRQIHAVDVVGLPRMRPCITARQNPVLRALLRPLVALDEPGIAGLHREAAVVVGFALLVFILQAEVVHSVLVRSDDGVRMGDDGLAFAAPEISVKFYRGADDGVALGVVHAAGEHDAGDGRVDVLRYPAHAIESPERLVAVEERVPRRAGPAEVEEDIELSGDIPVAAGAD